MLRLIHFSIAPLLLVLYCGYGYAHTLKPAVATLTINSDATAQLEVSLNLEAVIAGIGSAHKETSDSPNARRYDELRNLSAVELEDVFRSVADEYVNQLVLESDVARINLVMVRSEIPEIGDVDLARKSKMIMEGVLPVNTTSISWNYPEHYGGSVIRLRYGRGDIVQSHWLPAGVAGPKMPVDGNFLPRPTGSVVSDYLYLGFTHIMPLGLDHILFVLGIFLLSMKLSPILWQVTAFTLAHTVTLGLTMYGYISLSAAVVEPLIAISIVYVAVENIMTTELKPWRVVVVFLFGLLHGMGFAGVLTEIGLPKAEYLTALIAFNVGVEGGQLAVILLALMLVGWFRQHEWYRQRIVIPVSVLISMVGLYWTVERLFL